VPTASAAALNPRFLLVVVQYATRFNEEKLKQWLYDRNCGAIARKRFKVRLAQADDSLRLTGYRTGGVTPIGVATADLPVVLSASIVALQPPLFWLGAGDVDLKARRCSPLCSHAARRLTRVWPRAAGAERARLCGEVQAAHRGRDGRLTRLARACERPCHK
jgi:hypothetical protein